MLTHGLLTVGYWEFHPADAKWLYGSLESYYARFHGLPRR